MFGLVNASFSLPEWQAIKWFYFHPDYLYICGLCEGWQFVFPPLSSYAPARYVGLCLNPRKPKLVLQQYQSSFIVLTRMQPTVVAQGILPSKGCANPLWQSHSTSDQQTDAEIWLGIQLALSHAKFCSHLGLSAARIITKKNWQYKNVNPFHLRYVVSFLFLSQYVSIAWVICFPNSGHVMCPCMSP